MNRRGFLGALASLAAYVATPFRAIAGPAKSVAVPVAPTKFVTAKSGVWTDPTTWVGGVVPNANNSFVTIGAGHTVRLAAHQAVVGCRFDGGPESTLQMDEAGGSIVGNCFDGVGVQIGAVRLGG